MFAFDKPIVWVIILLIIVLLFGANRLTDIGKSLGKGIREFKEETSTLKENKVVASTSSNLANDEEVVVTKREGKREDGSIEIIEERVVRKRAQV
ncbi:twin-arginine translocase TatA/TatE family subunit [Candidatus Chlorohelix allophototropha]|uniref:Sec-independent protein translocase protein TatA n=1 Tax=Candidatus Chlorohelix allophototropha TaxID=3003348 RepID=A0ABY9B6V7_9CHLR|nr:twin-arginine translocase TatA/TatE family subunit [Chloroflexota bacterium L227-S17]